MRSSDVSKTGYSKPSGFRLNPQGAAQFALFAAEFRKEETMARRPLLTEDQWARLLAPPTDERITDLLLEVNHWTSFSECFTHQRNGHPYRE